MVTAAAVLTVVGEPVVPRAIDNGYLAVPPAVRRDAVRSEVAVRHRATRCEVRGSDFGAGSTGRLPESWRSARQGASACPWRRPTGGCPTWSSPRRRSGRAETSANGPRQRDAPSEDRCYATSARRPQCCRRCGGVEPRQDRVGISFPLRLGTPGLSPPPSDIRFHYCPAEPLARALLAARLHGDADGCDSASYCTPAPRQGLSKTLGCLRCRHDAWPRDIA